MTIPTKNEMFAEFANCKNIDERIEYVKKKMWLKINVGCNWINRT